jgi:hypothetical protein
VAVFGFRLFAAAQSGLFGPIGFAYFGQFAFDKFSYLIQITDIASNSLILIVFTGIVVEISKYFAPSFSPIKHGHKNVASAHEQRLENSRRQ